MKQLTCLLLCLLSLGLAEPDVGDGTQVGGTLSFTVTPDEKSKKAGATSFDDTLEFGNDRVKSKVLTAEGFPVGLSIPKTVNGVVTFNVTFKKAGASATYFIRAKPDGAVNGSLTRSGGGKTLRYTVGATGTRDAATTAPAKKPDATLDPAVLRVNGGFIRLMSVQVAMADAGVKSDKSKVAAVLKAAGNQQHTLQAALAQRKLTPEQYSKQADTHLVAANKSLAELLGADAAKVESAYAAPFASGYVHLNQMRAAVAESDTSAKPDDAARKRADQSIYQALIELTTLAKKPDALTPEAVAKITDRTRTEVVAALGAEQRERFEQMLTGLASYKPE